MNLLQRVTHNAANESEALGLPRTASHRQRMEKIEALEARGYERGVEEAARACCGYCNGESANYSRKPKLSRDGNWYVHLAVGYPPRVCAAGGAWQLIDPRDARAAPEQGGPE